MKREQSRRLRWSRGVGNEARNVFATLGKEISRTRCILKSKHRQDPWVPSDSGHWWPIRQSSGGVTKIETRLKRE